MPPEQVSGDVEHMGPACDIYALGVILYELLTGRLPFQGAPMQVLCQVLTDTPPPPSAHRPHLDEGLEAVCLKAMAKKPDDRFALMADFAAALARYSQFRDERPLWKRLPRWAWAAGGTAALLVVAIVLLIGLMGPRQAPTDSQPAESGPVAETILTNSIGMKLVPIPAGKFLMGAMAGELGANPHESPRHRVAITRPFHMGACEVTQAQFAQVMGFNPSFFTASARGGEKVAGLDTSNFPVECVSWGEAVDFCRKLSELPAEVAAGRAYRLPTEAEWEYACRVGTETAFSTGGTLSAKQANINGWFRYGTSERGPNLARTTAVGSFPPNDLGLFDMHGNVWEWCHDWYDGNYYSKSPADDPAGPDKGELRIMRGGGWFHINAPPGVDQRCAHRGARPPGARLNFLGFRVVCVPAPGWGPMPGPLDPIPAGPSSEKAIDLLKLIDLQKTYAFGDWRLKRGILISPMLGSALFQLPYEPPDEYQVVMVVERSLGNEALILGAPVGGQRASIFLDGHTSSRSGLGADGRHYDQNETTHQGRVLTNGRKSLVVYTVRKDGIEVTCDGNSIINWKGDPGRLLTHPVDHARNPRALSLMTFSIFQISRLELIPLTGQGRQPSEYAGELRRLRHGPHTHGLAISPDGRYVFNSLGHPHLWLYDCDNLRAIRSFHGQRAGAGLGVAFANEGKWALAGCYDGTVRLWDVATGEDLWHWSGYPGYAEGLAVLPDGRHFLTGHNDGAVRLWELPTEKMIHDPNDPHGLKAEYFQGHDLKDKVAERIDRQIDWLCESSAPIDRVGQEHYSIRWTGWLKAPAPGKYHLTVHVDDGIRLWLDDKLLMNKWDVGGYTHHADVVLTDRPHALKIEYFQSHGPAYLTLRWSKVGGFAEQPIPAEALFHDEQAAERTQVQLPRELRRLVGHDKLVSSVSVAPNGRDVLTSSCDGTIRLWDLQTGKEVRRYRGHEGIVWCAAFSPDGRRALSAGADRTVRQWDVGTGKEIGRYLGHRGEVRWLAYSPDGRRAASASYDYTVRLWDLEATSPARKQLHCFLGHWANAHAVAFTADGKRLLSTSADCTVRLWQIPSDEALRRQWPEPERQPPGQPVDLLKRIDFKDHFMRGKWEFAGDALLAPIHGWIEVPYSPPDEYRLEMTMVRSGKPDAFRVLFPIGERRGMLILDGNFGASSGLFFMDGREGHTPEALHRGLVLKDGQPNAVVLTVKSDRVHLSCNGATIFDWVGDPRRLWIGPGWWGPPEKPTLALLNTTAACTYRISRLVLTPLSGTGRPVQLDGEIRRFQGHNTWSVAVSPDGTQLVSAGEPQLRFWDQVNGTLLGSVEAHRGEITWVAYSPDGRHILTGSKDRSVRLWEASTHTLLRSYPGYSGEWTRLAFSPDGRTAASAGVDAKIRLWDLTAEKGKDQVRTLEADEKTVWSVAFSPDPAQLVSASEDGAVRLWDAATGKVVRRFEAKTGPVFRALFTPDGRRIVASGADHYIRIWDAATGKQVGRLGGHRALVACLATSADGRRLLSGSEDATVRLWDLETGKELHRFTGHTGWVRSVAFHPDGRRVVSGGRDATVRIWLLPEALRQPPRGN
jgi:WD40 repeat protein/formylglycine-generating enzyme required for sulfatase activity